MKKIIFFSLENGWLGGVAQVNAALKEPLENLGFQVENLFLRKSDYMLPEGEENTTVGISRPWRFVTGSQIREAMKKKKFLSALSLLLCRIRDQFQLSLDLHRAKRHLLKADPDCIVVSSYLLLSGVPKKLWGKTLHHVHTSFAATMSQPANARTLRRYNGKIGFLWLSRGIRETAEAEGFSPSFFVYNPLKAFPEERGMAEEKKTVSVITRFSPEKRLPLAVRLLKRAMDALPDPGAFRVQFWGSGPEEAAIREAIGADPRFSLMGETREPFHVLENTRFTLNTSAFEGFSISILEAAAAGVPTVSFLFGEACREEILDGETGFVVPMDQEAAFVEKLILLFSSDDLVRTLSLGAREYAERFQKEKIGADWNTLLAGLPLDKREKA